MYKDTAKYYDKIYYEKNYKEESEKIHRLIGRYKKTKGNTMLDVACGTGTHMCYLRKHYNITGVDLSREMLSEARRKMPTAKLIHADMRDFRLNTKFEVIVCLFSSIAHMLTLRDLSRVMRNFSDHLKTGGITIIEPFISPDKYRKNFLHAVFVNQSDLKLVRMNLPKKKGNLFLFDVHFLIMTTRNVKYFNKKDFVRMFTTGEYLGSMRSAGLKAWYLKNGLMRDRGLYIGIKK